MKVLVVGGGGREHALAWKLAQSPEVTDLYCAPGNPGIRRFAEPVDIAVDEITRLADFATDLGIDLTVVGPELPLTLGLVDEFAHRGLIAFGPRRDAARLEGSKVFAKSFMKRHGIPTASARVVHDKEAARTAVGELGNPVVLKADGLAAGKGVILVDGEQALEQALSVFFDERRFGTSGDQVIVEEFLVGEELSFIALSDGERLLPMATSKDYKKIGEGDRGPNTGGMGAHSPSGVVDSETGAAIVEGVLRPVVEGLAAEGWPFVGFLYAGLILTEEGPRVLEFNVRLGDPEAQPLLLRLEDDLAPLLLAGACGRFQTERLRFRRAAAAGIVLASRGYPGTPARGEPIEGLDSVAGIEGVEVFHCGTREIDGGVVAWGGRVLTVCATDKDLRSALRRAYRASSDIRWPSKVLRRDIGRRVLESRGAVVASGRRRPAR